MIQVYLIISSVLQIKKATDKFLKWSQTGGWRFDDWNSWRMKDGMLCRTTNDCKWLDMNLRCQDYKLASNISRAWFGGDFDSIRGKCQCKDGVMDWDDEELECQPSLSVGMIVLYCFIGVVGLVIICAACFFCGRKL